MRFLIVEDNETTAIILENYLISNEQSSNRQCEVVGDGVLALSRFKEEAIKGNPFDLVFLDIMLPGVDGHKILKSIREFELENKIKPTKVVMLSALDDPSNVIGASKAGCDGYLVKPFSKEQIKATLDNLGMN